jgi:type II secretory pathway component PulJ
MIEVMAALAVANSAFKSVQTLMERGAELEQMVGQLGKWYTAASDIRAAGELQKPSAFRRLVDSKSVETEALNQIIAKKKLLEHERELRSMIVMRFGIESYKEMIQMRRDIRATREQELYAKMRLKQNIVDAAILGVGAMVSIAMIVAFFTFITDSGTAT